MLYDKETKDTEIVKWGERIEDYMAREVLPHIPDAKAFLKRISPKETGRQDRRGDPLHPLFLQVSAAGAQRGTGSKVYGVGTFGV